MHYQRWDQTDRRGPIRAHLLTVDPGKRPACRSTTRRGAYVPDRSPVGRLVARDRAVAGVNGGFFDIHDTGAPLGVGVDRQRGFLHAARYTWNNAFYITRGGAPRIGALQLSATVDQYPQMDDHQRELAARCRAASIGVYSPDWGQTSGYRDHRRPDEGRADGRDQERPGGRQPDHAQLRQADRRHRAGRPRPRRRRSSRRCGSARRRPCAGAWPDDPAFAISGEKVLLRDGKLQVTDDRELHPRTAVGIDRDTGRVLLLVVDGRSKPQPRLHAGRAGADDAPARRRGRAQPRRRRFLDDGRAGPAAGGVALLNRPSDGRQRSVADALVVKYRKP